LFFFFLRTISDVQMALLSGTLITGYDKVLKTSLLIRLNVIDTLER
jgi:hypothetical protein